MLLARQRDQLLRSQAIEEVNLGVGIRPGLAVITVVFELTRLPVRHPKPWYVKPTSPAVFGTDGKAVGLPPSCQQGCSTFRQREAAGSR